MTQNNENVCTHPISRRTRKTKVIHGEVLEVEVCKECGRILVKPKDAQKLLTRRGREGEPLTSRKVILALLGTFPERPIINRIVMMKEAFLLEKEVARDIGLNIESLRFTPYEYGPYSKPVDDALRQLEEERLIQIEREAHGQKEIIKLTDKGKQIAQTLLETIPNEQTQYLKRKRKGWDQLGYYGILQKVYDEYPAYRSKSKITEKIKPGRRWT
jgi:DNA-binding PadR family transcriptional regulator